MCQNCSFAVNVQLRGKTTTIHISTETSIVALYDSASKALSVNVGTLKLLHKGKRLDPCSDAVFLPRAPPKTPKLMALSTASGTIQEVATRKADPTIRGLEQEIERDQRRSESKATQYPLVWGPATGQHKSYKFVRFQACESHDFGSRATDSAPHPFRAKALLHQLATDPGVRAVMKSRELVVNTLGEMDPIDDRIMQKQQSQQPGSCLLGYNTNHGLRIDIKLRSQDLSAFRGYQELVQTLLHELSHNWVGEHNLLFWTNYGNLRLEYLYTHFYSTIVVQGRTTSQIACLPTGLTLDSIYQLVAQELVQDMAQHGLHPRMIATALEQTCQRLKSEQSEQQQSVQGSVAKSSADESRSAKSPRELALEAAEKRRQSKEKE